MWALIPEDPAVLGDFPAGLYTVSRLPSRSCSPGLRLAGWSCLAHADCCPRSLSVPGH